MQINEIENENGFLTLMFELTDEEEKILLQYALKDIITKVAKEVEDEPT